MEHVPSRPLDAITAFAVPNPNCPSQSRRFFQVWSPSRSPRLADHSVYFGPTRFIVPTLSTVDGSYLNRALTKVNAKFWCKRGLFACAYQEMQMVVGEKLSWLQFNSVSVLHRKIHRAMGNCKTMKGNQIIVLTVK